MTIGRREFLAGAGALAVSARSVVRRRSRRPARGHLPASVRADFPSVALETYMNSAALHPLGTFAARAVEQAWRTACAAPARDAWTSAPTSSRT